MTDPFRVALPAFVSFSGGATSGLMLRRILDAFGGEAPEGLRVGFMNTGLERHETLEFVEECATRWGVEIAWLERRSRAQPCVEVTYETASRDGEPFGQLITERRYLPNAVQRLCTASLKVRVAEAFMRSLGYERWTNVIGLRRDERRRVARVREQSKEQWDTVVPLYDAGITRDDVAAFWRAQDFRLNLGPGEGNCNLCFLKGRSLREHLAAARPQDAAWWIAQEARIGARFHAHERGYADLLERAKRQLPLLPEGERPAELEAIPCNCTDRRRPRCGCRGSGHRLVCVFAKEAA